jgi:DNA-binding NarL/FixJ family response regulator
VSQMRILLADDHREFLDELAAFLAPHHHVVGAAADGEELVRLALSHHPDLILADISMPGMNGLMAVQKVNGQPTPPKSIFITMHSSPHYVKRALEIGALGFVLKPHVYEQIENAIQAVLADRIYLSPQLGFSLPAAK